MSDQFFQSELATLLEYSSLLKKQRSPQAEDEIKRIILEEKNMIARINRIKELDELVETEPEGGVSSVSTQINRQVKEEEKKAPVIKKVPFFSFLFTVRKILIHMCKESSILIAKFFGFRFQVSDETFSLLEEVRSNILNHILPILQRILENGWKVLEPYHYNTFYVLYGFLNNYIRNFVLDKKDLDRNLAFIDSFSRDFFTLIENKRHLQGLREGIYIFYGNKENDEMVEFLLFLEGVFDKRKKFSLLNYVLMNYSVHYRQPLSLEEMSKVKGIQEIPDTRYLVIQKVKYLMQDYYDKLKAKQSLNEKKLFFLKHVQEENPGCLETFIRENYSDKFKLEFFAADLLKSADDFLSAFLRYSKPVLMGELTISKESQNLKAVIFKDIWETQIARLEGLLKEISYQRETYKYLFITLENYEKYVEQNKHLESEKDEKLCALVDKAVMEIQHFFEALVQVLFNDYHLTYNESQEMIFEKLKTRDKSIVETETVRFLPYSSYVAKNYQETVSGVITRIATVAGTFLFIMGSEKIKERMREKNALMEASKRNIEQMMKISL